MNFVMLLPFGAAILQLAFGIIFLAISRARGWARARLFAVLALTASLYAFADIAYTLPHVDLKVLVVVVRLNYLLASIHCAAWLVYAFGAGEWRRLSRRLHALIGVTVLAASIGQIPGVLDAGGSDVLKVPPYGAYLVPRVTWFAEIFGVWLLVILALVFAHFVRQLRHGRTSTLAQVVGFAIFFACEVVEVLVANGVIDFLFPGDLGFLAIVAVVLIETVRRVLADARMLETLGRDLAVQVERRTQERDVAQEVLTQTAHLTAVGQLAAGVGHEINNPLTVAQVNLEILCEELNGTTLARPDSATLASEALESLRRIGRVVDDLRSAAKPTAALVDNVDARAIVRSAVQLTSHRLRHVANIKDELHEVVTIKADAVRLRQAFGNLLVNAAQALELGASGPPTIELRSRRIGPDRVAIEIVDHGVGMGPTTLARLSEPYFSTRHERGGMGLGLFVARNILAGLGGTLEFESELGRGTVARVILPIEPGAPQPQPPVEATPRDEPPRAASPLASRPRALVVDDEPMIARTIKRQLATFDVTVCSDGAEAFGVLEGDPNFDLIICDLMMPRMSGAELHAALTTTHPSYLARILFISGGAVTEHSIQFLARDDIHFVTKPFSRAELATAVEGIMTTNAAR